MTEHRVAHALALLSILLACGRAEELVLPMRPDRAQFDEIRFTLNALGCSANDTGCHSVLVGNYRLGPLQGDAAAIEDEFLLTKGLIDLEDPPNSTLLRVALEGDPLSIGHPICFKSVEACAFERILAWMSYEGPEDLRVEDVCPRDELSVNQCFLP